jgi:hypothetical protein
MIISITTFYIIIGLVLSGTIGMLLGLAITVDCKKITRCIASPIIALIVGFGLSAFFAANEKADKTKWNNGYCQKCGAELELFDIERCRGNETYYYRCENGHIIELGHLYETDRKED